MQPDSAEKKQVRITILNQSYTVSTSGEPKEMIELANQVDQLMAGIAAKAHNLDSARVAVLACLHLADRLRSLEGELSNLRHRVDEKAKQFTILLDQAIERDARAGS